MNDKSVLCGLAVLIFMTIIAGAVISSLRDENRRLRRDVEYFEKTYLRKNGSTALWEPKKGMVNYELRSFDGGIMWYACAFDMKDGSLKVLGEAETVYPGLLKHLDNMDRLTSHIAKNGPLKLDNAADISFLQGVGFEIKTNTP